MSRAGGDGPMRIRLSDERREDLLRLLREFHEEEFDRALSDFQAETMLNFFLRELGPPVYNQAVQDARAFLQEKLDDLEGDVHEPESTP